MRRVHFELTDSTNTRARELAAAHPGECILVSADEQQAGRGRLGRTWHSPRGGAWMSLAWPMRHEPRRYAAASLVAALATLETVVEVAPACADRLEVKWPNDLLLDGAKVAGILCEQFLGAGGGRDAVLVVGVGVNVDFDPVQLGDDLRHPATSLRAATGQSIAVADVVDGLSRRLVDALADFESGGLAEATLDALRARLAYAGSVQSFDVAGQVITGRVTGIDSAGRLVLACADGEAAFDSGELLTATTNFDPRST